MRDHGWREPPALTLGHLLEQRNTGVFVRPVDHRIDVNHRHRPSSSASTLISTARMCFARPATQAMLAEPRASATRIRSAYHSMLGAIGPHQAVSAL